MARSKKKTAPIEVPVTAAPAPKTAIKVLTIAPDGSVSQTAEVTP
jgi:hypothetical protein